MRAFLRGPMTHPVSIQTNTGDGLRMAMKAGADARQHARGVVDPRRRRCRRGEPDGAAAGQRPADAAALDHGEQAGPALHQRGGELQRLRRRRSTSKTSAGSSTPTSRAGWSSTRATSRTTGSGSPPAAWSVACPRGSRAATRRPQLAEKLGVTADELEATIERWNANCAEGHDPDFGRGDSAFDWWWGDPLPQGPARRHARAARRGPFYAIEVHSGAFGTKGGPRVDLDGPCARHRRRRRSLASTPPAT